MTDYAELIETVDGAIEMMKRFKAASMNEATLRQIATALETLLRERGEVPLPTATYAETVKLWQTRVARLESALSAARNAALEEAREEIRKLVKSDHDTTHVPHHEFLAFMNRAQTRSDALKEADARIRALKDKE